MEKRALPSNLVSLHSEEERCRRLALEYIARSESLQLHVAVVEAAMEVAEQVRQLTAEDEDSKAVRSLSIRVFNAFASAMALALAGYGQTAAMILRDILETLFLLDFFSHDPSAIARWRDPESRTYRNEFRPSSVRKVLDKRDGNKTGKRDALYKMFSELAAHPNIKSTAMLRPRPTSDARSGPFIESTGFKAIMDEMGKLAVEAGGTLSRFFPAVYVGADASRLHFTRLQTTWFKYFCGEAAVREANLQSRAKRSP